MGLVQVLSLLCVCTAVLAADQDAELDSLIRKLLQVARRGISTPEKRDAYIVMKSGEDKTNIKVNVLTTEDDRDCRDAAGCLFIFKVQDDKDREVETLEKMAKSSDKQIEIDGLTDGESYSVLTCRAERTADGGWEAVEEGDGRTRCSCHKCTMGEGSSNSIWAWMADMCSRIDVVSIGGRPACQSII